MNYRNNNWTIRFKDEIDNFFGKGNWECISEETKESIIYTTYIRVRENSSLSKEVPGKYKNWYIKFKNNNGIDEIWKISDHTFKINNDKYGIFSSKRYSNKQALALELMDISFEIASEEIYNEIIKKELPENIASCIDVSISYNGGNPKPEFYDKLLKQSWFNAKDVSAEKFLETDLHEFYLDIKAFDYKVNKLTDEEQQILWNSLNKIENTLLYRFEDNASFELYFDKEHQVEYSKGIKIKK